MATCACTDRRGTTPDASEADQRQLYTRVRDLEFERSQLEAELRHLEWERARL